MNSNAPPIARRIFPTTHRFPKGVTRGVLAGGIALASWGFAGCDSVCGSYNLTLPETRVDRDDFSSTPIERCEGGTQGNWDERGINTIAFQPDTKGLRANFAYSSMLITVSFRVEDTVPGALLEGNQLAGNAFYGLGYGRHWDEAPLNKDESWIRVISVGEEHGEGLFRKRDLEMEWNLVWTARESRWVSEGRRKVPMLRSTR